MMKSTDKDCQPSSSIHEDAESNLQPFFVLHRHAKTRRRIDVSRTRASIDVAATSKSTGQTAKNSHDEHLNFLKLDAFNYVWSKIETSIKDVLRNINLGIFNDVNSWVQESFKAIRSCGEPGFFEATRLYPIVNDTLSKKLFAGLIYTKNMEFVDDQLTFEELGAHLKSHGCFVANLTSMDFSAKNGIGGCLTCLLRQFVMVTLDAADLSILASWYYAQRVSKPVIVIIEDLERCCGSVLSDFILMLSEWVAKVPVILIMGVATTLDAPRNILSSKTLQLLCPSKFELGSPPQRLDALIEAVFLKPCSSFSVGHKVALFMRDYFLKHDGTLTSFIKALKIACMQHFFMEPLSFLMKYTDAADEKTWSENTIFDWEMVLQHSSQLDSCSRTTEYTNKELVKSLAELKTLSKSWATVILCLYAAGKLHKVPLLDLYCEALDPDPHRSGTYNNQGEFIPSNKCSSSQPDGSYKRVSISQVVRKVRELPPPALWEILSSWNTLADDISEVHKKVKQLLSMMKLAESKISKYEPTEAPLKPSSEVVSEAKHGKISNEKVVMVIEWMLKDYMKPIETMPLHEIFCFKDVNELRNALIGDPRQTIQADLLEFQKYLRCSCCSSRGNKLLPSLHDTSIMYVLAQEHGDLINVHDWYQSFKATVVQASTKARSKLKQSPSKKRKNIDHSPEYSEAAIQARFCRAISELQIVGLLRMPSKRRPDFVQRIAFGL